MRTPRSPILPQWKIDLVRGAIEFLEGEKREPVTAEMIAKRIPSFSLSNVENAIKFLKERHRTER
jgi:hypothetical protein